MTDPIEEVTEWIYLAGSILTYGPIKDSSDYLEEMTAAFTEEVAGAIDKSQFRGDIPRGMFQIFLHVMRMTHERGGLHTDRESYLRHLTDYTIRRTSGLN